MLADSYSGAEILNHLEKNGKRYARIKMKCDRCNGRGIYAIGVLNNQLIPSPLDHGVCYACNGDGYTIEVVRDYSESEYKALQRAKQKREAKRAEIQAAKAAEQRKEYNRETLNRYGFKDVYAYAIIGDSYSIKEDLKAHGAKFSYDLLWICPDEPTWLPSNKYTKICATDVFEMRDERLVLRDNANEFIVSLQPKTGEYLGNVGQRITVHVKVEKALVYKNEYMIGWPTYTTKYLMRTDDGNVAVWKTQTVDWEEGYECTLTGTIKELSEYRNVRQTILTRCKEVPNESGK